MSPINHNPDLKARVLKVYNPEAPVALIHPPVAPRVTFGKRKASK